MIDVTAKVATAQLPAFMGADQSTKRVSIIFRYETGEAGRT